MDISRYPLSKINKKEDQVLNYLQLLTDSMQLLTLVPNHLSTQKSTNPHPPYHTRIRHYSLLFTPPTSPHNKNHTRNGGEVKKRVAASGKKVKRSLEYHTTEGAEGKKVGKSVVERCISTPIPNYLSTLTFTSNA